METGAGPPPGHVRHLGFFYLQCIFLRFRKYDDVSHASPHFQRHYGACKSKTGKLRTGNRFLRLKVKHILFCFFSNL